MRAAYASPPADPANDDQTAAVADLVATLGCSEADARAIILARFGPPPPPPPPLELPAPLRPAVRLFFAVVGQWRTAGMGSVVGLDLCAVDVAARWLGLAQTPELLRDVQLMEREALAIMAERR